MVVIAASAQDVRARTSEDAVGAACNDRRQEVEHGVLAATAERLGQSETVDQELSSPPSSKSAPPLLVRWSAPGPPRRTSAAESPAMVSSPLLPLIVSPPASDVEKLSPEEIESFPAPPLT